MKLSVLLQLAAVGAAFVVPNAQVFQDLQVEAHEATDNILAQYKSSQADVYDKLEHTAHRLEESFENIVHKAEGAFDDAGAWTDHAVSSMDESVNDHYLAGKSWLESAVVDSKHCLDENIEETLNAMGIRDYSHPPHRRPGHGRPGRGRPGHGHHGKSNKTVFELIAKSKYTTKLAKLVSEHDDLVKLLNGTSANFTVFAPTDKAFAKIPKDAPKPSKEQLKELLTYHVSSGFYPVGRIFGTRTIPTLFEEKSLGKHNAQRLSTNFGLRGLLVNLYSRVVAVNIEGSNGVIHGIDNVLVVPPKALDIIGFFPASYSTLSLALIKTGLDEALNSTKHAGGTLFAPTNHAFGKLGPAKTAFLFSKHGLKYLKALIKYHVVPDRTLYSDAFYDESSSSDGNDGEQASTLPGGVFHVDLPTLLEDRSLSIDIARWGRLIEIKINAFDRVELSDIVAKDGVIHNLGQVLIPPRKVGGSGESLEAMSIEELCERLEPFVAPDWEEL